MSKIIFTSEIMQNGDKNKISFKSPLMQSKYDEFDVYEFKEPSNNIMNRIEISKTTINIFAGSSTISMVLNEKLPIEYNTPSGSIILNSFLKKKNVIDNKIIFEYTLSEKEKLIGEYKITLEVINGK